MTGFSRAERWIIVLLVGVVIGGASATYHIYNGRISKTTTVAAHTPVEYGGRNYPNPLNIGGWK